MGDYQRKPGSPLAAAGARRGDQIIFDRDRHQMRAIGVGETVGVTLFVQTAQPRHVVVRAQRDTAVSFLDRLAEAAGLFALRGALEARVLELRPAVPRAEG